MSRYVPELVRTMEKQRSSLERRLGAAIKIAEKAPPNPKYKGLQEYFTQVPRNIWGEVLMLSAGNDKRAEDLLILMSDDKQTMKNIVLMAAECEIEIYTLTGWVRLWYDHINHLFASEESFHVMRDIAADARNREEPCKKCGGSKRVGKGDEERDCKACAGTGTILIHGDHRARRQLLEMQGLLASRAANNVMVNVMNGPTSVQDILGRSQEAINKLEEFREKHEEPDVIEGEVVEP